MQNAARMHGSTPRRACLALLGLVLFALACGRSRPGGETSPPRPDSVEVREPVAVAPPPPDTLVTQPRYRVVKIANRRALIALWKELGPQRFLLALKVNRRDSLHVRDGDSLMIPDPAADLLDLAPFPRELPSARDLAKLTLVSRRVQAFAAYEHGRMARWGPTSTGRESLETPEGLYHTNWKDKHRTSTFNDEWLLEWYVNLDNFLGISFHLFDLPGYPASHSCIRLLLDDATWLYDWVDSWTVDPADRRRVLTRGTPVVVFGQFAYGRKSPWRKLAADSAATNVTLSQVDAALAAYLRSGRPTPIDSLRAATLKALALARRARADSTDSLGVPAGP